MTRKEKIYKYICHEGYKPLTKQELCITLDSAKKRLWRVLRDYWGVIGRGQARAKQKGQNPEGCGARPFTARCAL